jgi:hypothetical protein
MKKYKGKIRKKRGAKDISTREALDTEEGLTAFCDAIVRERGVLKACNALGLDRGQIWLYLAKHPDAQTAVSLARQETAHALFDECCDIADNAKREDWAIARLRIETRMRAAGKLNQRAYGDQPRHLTQTYVQGNVEIKADENTRRAMIDARARFLADRTDSDRTDSARRSPDAASASQRVAAPPPRLKVGRPIGSIIGPEDPMVTHMRSFENGITEDQAIAGTPAAKLVGKH